MPRGDLDTCWLCGEVPEDNAMVCTRKHWVNGLEGEYLEMAIWRVGLMKRDIRPGGAVAAMPKVKELYKVRPWMKENGHIL